MVRRLCLMALMIVVALAFARVASAQDPTVEADGKYGAGGTKTTTVVKNADGTGEETVVWKDAKGVVRQKGSTTWDKDGNEVDTDQWFDEQGKKTRETVGKYDYWDYEDYWRDEKYVGGVLDSGDIWEWDPTTWDYVHKRWNDKDQRYEVVPQLRLDPFKNLPGFQKHVLAAASLYVGFATVLEDGGQSFGTYGVNATYTHPLNKLVGIMADFQWTRGSDDFQTYTKMQILGGLALCQHVHQSWSITPHVLAGMAMVTPSSSGVSYDSTSAFSLAAGVDFGMRFNRQIEWIGRADYNPTFSDGVQNNFRFSTGLRLRF